MVVSGIQEPTTDWAQGQARTARFGFVETTSHPPRIHFKSRLERPRKRQAGPEYPRAVSVNRDNFRNRWPRVRTRCKMLLVAANVYREHKQHFGSQFFAARFCRKQIANRGEFILPE